MPQRAMSLYWLQFWPAPLQALLLFIQEPWVFADSTQEQARVGVTGAGHLDASCWKALAG
jgi:hypothetical protein